MSGKLSPSSEDLVTVRRAHSFGSDEKWVLYSYCCFLLVWRCWFGHFLFSKTSCSKLLIFNQQNARNATVPYRVALQWSAWLTLHPTPLTISGSTPSWPSCANASEPTRCRCSTRSLRPTRTLCRDLLGSRCLRFQMCRRTTCWVTVLPFQDLPEQLAFPLLSSPNSCN